MAMLRYWTIIAVASVTIASASASADPRADTLAETARGHAAAGDYRAALKTYQQAYAVEPKAAYRCNIGVAYYRLAQWPQAHFSLAECLAETASLDADVVAAVSKAYAYVERTLKAGDFAPVRFLVSPVSAALTLSFLDSTEKIGDGRLVWVPFGTHTVNATASGYAAASVEFEVSNSSQIEQEITLVALPEDTAVVGESRQPAAASSKTVKSLTDLPSPLRRDLEAAPRRGAAWTAFGISAAALVGGVVFHIAARGTRSDAAGLRPGTAYEDKVSQLHRQQYAVAGFYSLAALAASAGGYLWLKATRDSRVLVGPALARRRVGVWARWSL